MMMCRRHPSLLKVRGPTPFKNVCDDNIENRPKGLRPRDKVVESYSQQLTRSVSMRTHTPVRPSVCLADWCARLESASGRAPRTGIKLMRRDQGPVPLKLSLWLRAIIQMGSKRTLADAGGRWLRRWRRNQTPARVPLPGPINAYISIRARSSSCD